MDNIIYIISVGFIILVLSSAYFLILNKHKAYNINRYYLLLIPFFSMVVPLISINVHSSGGVIPILLEQFEVSGAQTSWPSGEVTIPFGTILLFIYLAGVILMIFKLIFDLVKIINLISNSTREIVDGISVHINSEAIDAFTFINKIIVPGRDISRHILLHEFYHLKQLHFIDLFIAELVRIVFWFVPGIGIYKKAVVMNHEFSADQYSGSHGKIDEYCERLLSTVFKIESFSACHTFNNYSITKSRIKMMYKKNSAPLRVIINYLLIVPFILFAVVIASAKHETIYGNQNNSTNVMLEEDVVQPQYPGGKDALYKFMGENIKFTDAAKAEGKEGTVFVKFIISSSGKVENATVLKGVSDELDNEALRVVRLMPDWIPGTNDGKKVNMEMTLPIKFLMK